MKWRVLFHQHSSLPATCHTFSCSCLTTMSPMCRSPPHLQCINRWLSVRLEMLGITVVFLTALLVGVALPRDAGLAGLAITSALNLTG